MSVTFKATNEQLRHLQALATNASTPRGLGLLHYEPHKTFTKDDFGPENAEHTDYVQGRMVKCHVFKNGEDTYEIREPHHDYQSWAEKYPTARALIEAAGLTVVEETKED